MQEKFNLPIGSMTQERIITSIPIEIQSEPTQDSNIEVHVQSSVIDSDDVPFERPGEAEPAVEAVVRELGSRVLKIEDQASVRANPIHTPGTEAYAQQQQRLADEARRSLTR